MLGRHCPSLSSCFLGLQSFTDVVILSAPSIHPHYILKYQVVADFGLRRTPHRDAVIALAGRYKRERRLVMAGAMGDLTGVTLVFRTRGDAEHYMAEDPYINNGLVTSHELAEWSVVM